MLENCFFKHPSRHNRHSVKTFILIFGALLNTQLAVLFLHTRAQAAQSKPLQVGLVLDKGGKDDQSFNAAAFKGAQKAQQELGVTLKVVEATDDNAFEGILRNFSKARFDLIISVGFAQAEALAKVAQANNNLQYAIVDTEVSAPNVRSLLFQEHEGSFLVGALAGLSSKTGKLGFIGGMDIPLIRRFQTGFEAGAKSVNPKATVVNQFVGVSGDAWNNPARAKELAMNQFQAGVEIIFGAAGASTLGILDAAEQKKKLAIGVDSNQNHIKPGFVLTSMLKRVDVAVFNVIREMKDGQFKPGVEHFGLANNGVDFALDRHNEKLIAPETLKRINQIKADIIAGKIKVPDAYEKK